MSETQTIQTFVHAEERLAASLPTYESRPQQQAAALAIEEAISSGRHLVVQAGCGTGKSFAYLIPAILSGKRAVISTESKALQDQIGEKDLPFLAEHLGVDFSFFVLKGRSNYLCTNRALDAENVARLGDILRRADDEDFTGERDSLGFEVSDFDWSKVASNSEDCQALGCKDKEGCFAQRARDIAKESQVVVVNHALYFTDLMVQQLTNGNANLIGLHDVFIADEAHTLEEWASQTLGSQFTQAGMSNLSSEVRNWAVRIDHATAEVAVEATRTLTAAAADLWSKLEAGRIYKSTMTELEDEWVAVALALQGLNAAIIAVDTEDVPTADMDSTKRKKKRLTENSASMARRFTDLIVADFTGLVRWVEERTTRRNEKQLDIKSAPVNVGEILRGWLWETTDGPTAILTSATLMVNGKADYITGRLGLDTFDATDVGTPFDFSTQAVLYVPEDLPSPARETAKLWESASIAEMDRLVRASDGRALLLFTSTRQMRAAYEALSRTLPYTTMMQGEAPNRELVERFKADHHSVLFAVKSFFTGFDVQGAGLSLVVMDKLPFPVPTEPITEARCEAIRNAGGNDFGDYTIPVMSLTLQQGFGRLIRHREDTGVVAILDSRLVSKGYGRTILRDMPGAPLVTEFSGVEGAFASFTL